MKKALASFCGVAIAMLACAQQYPEPEFINEVYYLQKDSVYSLVRLEKSSSKLDSKTKMGGIGGYESGYNIEGSKSPIRLRGGHISFVFSTGKSSSTSSSTSIRDSMMRANGIDPKSLEAMEEMNDPIKMLTLYKMDADKNGRKIMMQKGGGAMPFASKKTKSSDKFSFSVRNIKPGYYEMVIDKSLEKGEYAFTYSDMQSMATGGVTIFAFAIE